MRIYYVGARLTKDSCELLNWLTKSKREIYHTTIAYSREWFSYDPHTRVYPIKIMPPYEYMRLADNLVLAFACDLISARHWKLRLAGATWDFPNYNSHITLDCKEFPETQLEQPLYLAFEYYMTWNK